MPFSVSRQSGISTNPDLTSLTGWVSMRPAAASVLTLPAPSL